MPDRPYTEKYDLFLVDVGCFQDLLQAGTLRAIDEGDRVHRRPARPGPGRAAAVVRADPGLAALALTIQPPAAGGTRRHGNAGYWHQALASRRERH